MPTMKTTTTRSPRIATAALPRPSMADCTRWTLDALMAMDPPVDRTAAARLIDFWGDALDCCRTPEDAEDFVHGHASIKDGLGRFEDVLGVPIFAARARAAPVEPRPERRPTSAASSSLPPPPPPGASLAQLREHVTLLQREADRLCGPGPAASATTTKSSPSAPTAVRPHIVAEALAAAAGPEAARQYLADRSASTDRGRTVAAGKIRPHVVAEALTAAVGPAAAREYLEKNVRT
jgi:hypothetical protein